MATDDYYLKKYPWTLPSEFELMGGNIQVLSCVHMVLMIGSETCIGLVQVKWKHLAQVLLTFMHEIEAVRFVT